MKKVILIIIVSIFPFFILFANPNYNYLKPNPFNKLVKFGKSFINWSKGYALAWGKSKVDMGAENILLNRNRAEREATEKALLDLTNMLIKIRVNAFKTIYDFIQENRDFAILFNKYIHEHSFRLMPITKNYTNVLSGIVFKFFGEKSLLEVFFEALKHEPVKRVPLFNNNRHMEIQSYTGLVIDARGMNFTPNLFPAIFVIDKHGIQRTIFSYNHLNRKRSLTVGSVRYTRTAYNIYRDKYVGNKPYICHADKVSGEFNTDLFISRSDAIKLLSSSRTSKKLEEGRVLIIID